MATANNNTFFIRNLIKVKNKVNLLGSKIVNIIEINKFLRQLFSNYHKKSANPCTFQRKYLSLQGYMY